MCNELHLYRQIMMITWKNVHCFMVIKNVIYIQKAKLKNNVYTKQMERKRCMKFNNTSTHFFGRLNGNIVLN